MSGNRKLGKPTDQRMAMMRAMVTYLLENGQIKTTLTRAKEVAPMAEKMISLAKTNNLASYRQALAFITLCRCAGIPAKWQSGQCADPDSVGMHDWAMFYVAPYGWMFADCSFGGSAFQAGAEERRNHYFGNLDIYRNVTTNTFMADFEPQSKFFRYDPYDNQRGEVEDSKRGYPRWEVRADMEMISLEEIEG